MSCVRTYLVVWCRVLISQLRDLNAVCKGKGGNWMNLMVIAIVHFFVCVDRSSLSHGDQGSNAPFGEHCKELVPVGGGTWPTHEQVGGD